MKTVLKKVNLLHLHLLKLSDPMKKVITFLDSIVPEPWPSSGFLLRKKLEPNLSDLITLLTGHLDHLD